jgi:capsular exopolysaccharide synthesis family protein
MDPLTPAPADRVLARVTPRVFVPPVSLGEASRPGPKAEQAGVFEYWRMVRRHKPSVIAVVLVGAIAGFLYTLPQERIYQARTTIEIQGLNDDFLGMHNVSPTVSSSSSYYPDFDIQTQVKILQSRSLLKSVVEQLEGAKRPADLRPANRLSAWKKALGINPVSQQALWEEAIDSAAGDVKIRASGTNRIVEITCDSTQPAAAAAFANTLTRAFIQQNLEARWKSTEYTGEWLTKQLQDIKIKLEKDEDEMSSYARASGLTFTDEKTSVDDEKLRALQKGLLQAQDDRVAKQSKYEMAKASPPEALPDVLDDSTLRDYEANLTDLRRQYAQLRVNFTPTHPDVRKIQVQISLMEATLEKERAKILNRIQNEYEAAEGREKLLSASYATQVHLVDDQAVKTSHYNILKRQVDSSRQLYDTMLQRLKEASVTSALRASNIRVVDPADIPSVPYKPDVFRYVVTGLLLGCACAFGMVVLQERADRTIREPGDIAHYLHLPELAAIPAASFEPHPKGRRLPVRARTSLAATAELFDGSPELTTWFQKNSQVAEAFRTALTSILFSSRTGERPRVLLLSSASPSEGKTTAVCNLAIALAEINQKVLIIDADLRRPRMHHIFGLPNDDHGLSELLLSDHVDPVALTSSIQDTPIPGLHLLASGAARISAASLLHSERLPELIRVLRDRFDRILIDTPPVVNIPDGRVIARQVDGVILILRSAVTTRDAAILARQRFLDDGIPLMGAILNDWNPKSGDSSYYRNYYSDYAQYYGNGNGQSESETGGKKRPRAQSA